LIERLHEEGVALLGFAIIALENSQYVLFPFINALVIVLELRLEKLLIGEVRTILVQRIGVFVRHLAAPFKQVGKCKIALDLRYSIEIPGFGKLIKRFLFHALALRLG